MQKGDRAGLAVVAVDPTQNPPDCYRARRELKADKKRGDNGDLLLPIASARTLRFRGMGRETGRACNDEREGLSGAQS